MKTLKTSYIIAMVVTFFMLQSAFGQFGKASKVDLPPTYDFTWIMKMEMKTKKATVGMDYYMKEDATYFGFKNDMLAKQTEGGDMFMVMDISRDVSSIFMEMMGRKILQKTSLNGLIDSDDTTQEFTYKEIGSKTILGYKCDGYQAENAEHKVTFYLTDEVPVSFTKVWGADKKSMPKGFNTAWMKKYADNGAVLEMQFEDKKKAKNNSSMTCISIEKTNFSITTSEYKSMF